MKNSIERNADGVLALDGADEQAMERVISFIERRYPDVAVTYLEDEDVTLIDFRPVDGH